MRKLALFTVSGLALLATMGLGAQGALATHPDDPNEDCAGREHGVYDLNMNIKKFKLTANPLTEFAITELTGTGQVCGTDPSAPTSFLDSFQVLTPGRGEEIRCANPASTLQYCIDQTDPDLTDGAYQGNSLVDTYCTAPLCQAQADNENIATQNYIDHDTSNPSDPAEVNRCLADAVACVEARTELLGGLVTCNADTITTKPSESFAFTVYPADCYAGGTRLNGKIHFYKIRNLLICRDAGAVDGTACGTNDADWQNKNGAARAGNKPVKYTVKAFMTNADVFKASAKVKWENL